MKVIAAVFTERHGPATPGLTAMAVGFAPMTDIPVLGETDRDRTTTGPR